jgi:septal ring factor EnvC (AmiA/AmiB activator)
MLTDQERAERDPAALQQALLQIEKEIAELGPELIAAKMKATECDFRLKILKERKSALQSTLKSISSF